MKYVVTISKGTVSYEVEAEDEEEALDIADEWYNERDYEVCEVSEVED